MKAPTLCILTALGIAVAAPNGAVAKPDYPLKPVRLVVPFPPGGINDVLARVLGQKLTENLGVTVVIDNRPGAGGTIGSNIAAKAVPDGYTLLFGATSTVAVSPSMYSKLPYDPVKDFSPIVQIASVASVLIVNPSLPVQSAKELITLAKAKPGQLNFGSAGAGTSHHLGGELFNTLAGINMVHVPYKGGAPAMTDLIGGQISILFEPLPTALPQIKGRKVRPLAVTTPQRSPVLPDLPTIAAAGLPGYDLTIWFGVLAPARTSREIVNRLNAEILKVLQSADVRERLAAQGAESIGDNPGQFAAHIEKEITRWAAVVKASGARID